MNTKNDAKVTINGKQYTICGYESLEYIQQIAGHINEKFSEFTLQEGYRHLDLDMRNILLAVNLSDDFYKAQRMADDLRSQKEEMEKEIFDMKHELIEKQSKVAALEKQLKEAKEATEQASRKVIRLEAELGKANAEQAPVKTTTTTTSRRKS